MLQTKSNGSRTSADRVPTSCMKTENAYDEEGVDDNMDPMLCGNTEDILAGDVQDPDEEIARDIFDEVENPITLPPESDNKNARRQ